MTRPKKQRLEYVEARLTERETRRPISGEVVELSVMSEVNGTNLFLGKAKTGADGKVEIPYHQEAINRLEPGTYYLTVSFKGSDRCPPTPTTLTLFSRGEWAQKLVLKAPRRKRR